MSANRRMNDPATVRVEFGADDTLRKRPFPAAIDAKQTLPGVVRARTTGALRRSGGARPMPVTDPLLT
jgi:hypothetical protein